MTVALCLLLAGTLLAAGLAKARDPRPLRSTLRALTGERPAAVLALAVPAAEIILAAALVAGAGAGGRAPAAAAALLLIAFTAALAVLRRRRVPCHCFGAAGNGGLATGQLRNLGLAAAALVLVAQPAGALWSAGASELAGASTVALGAACAWLLATALARERAPA